ncbi:hypothetical protein HWV62_42072 [Athelia sp. TMB]|nr:hypothetical protein HWV62_42072 [Athelia sp. TMB]
MTPHIRTLKDLETNPMVSTGPLTSIPEDGVAKNAQSQSYLTKRTTSFPLQTVGESADDDQQSEANNGTVVLSDGMCFSGGYGDVWLGRLEDGLNRRSASFKVAVKVERPLSEYQMKPETTPDPNSLARELAIWKELKHENIVPLLGTITGFSPYKSPGMVSPWMENGNITDYQRTKNLTVRARLQILCDISAGLEYLHSKNIIHGDLTGTNILIDENEKACLTGFGLFTIKAEHGGTTYWSSTLGGGMRYRAPELLPPLDSDKLLDFKPVVTLACDIYSMGSIILQNQMLSGTVPYKELRSDVYVLLTLAHGIKPKRPKNLILTDSYWNFIDKCWAKAPDDRPKAGEVNEALNEFLGPCKDLPEECHTGSLLRPVEPESL